MRQPLSFITGCFVMAMLAVPAASDQDAPAVVPTFRSGIDVTTLDVSVLDKDRQPVRGLTAADFTVLERGKPLPVRAFSQVDIPRRQPPTASWMRDVAPDVVDNTPPKGRVLAVVIDDASLACCADVWGMVKTRAIVSSALDELGPDDVAAVTATMINHAAQGFTKDRQLLLTSLRDAAVVPGPKDLGQSGMCYCGACASEALERVTQALMSFPDRRKTLMFVSAGYPLDAATTDETASGLPPAFSSVPAGCAAEILDHTIKTLRNAALANIAIQAVDPNGLCTTGTTSSRTPGGSDCRSHDRSLRVLAEHTGGRAVVQNNDADREVPALFRESSTYYLLSIDTSEAQADGRFHPITVRVNRPDVDVRTRSGYYAPTAKERATLGAASAMSNPAIDIASVMPKPDVPLQATVAPFLAPDGKPTLATVLSVADPVATAGTAARTIPVDIATSVFEQENGTSFGTTRQRLTMTRTAGDVMKSAFEVLSPFAIRPGRYEVRISAGTGDQRSGSVYAYTTVPDFVKEPVSLSGLVLSADPTPPAAPPDAFAAFLPVRPTARRTFQIGDHVEAFLRVYQATGKTTLPVAITTRIVDSKDARVDGETLQVDAARFDVSHSVDYTFALPLDRLDPGEFLLEVAVTLGERRVTRTLRFSVE